MAYIFHKTYEGEARLDGKTTIITGSTSGIGKEVAREFYKRGARVLMACRNMQKTEDTIEEIKKSTESISNVGELVFVKLDLCSLESVRKCANEILESEPCIHVLVNNAAVCWIPKQLSEDNYELHFAVNHLGHFLLTLLLLPRLIKSAPARIIIVSSSHHSYYKDETDFDDINYERTEYGGKKAYNRSKLANVLFAAELGKKLAGTGVTTYSLHPGGVYTPNVERIIERLPFVSLGKTLASYLLKTPAQGAQTILYCALDDECGEETGMYYDNCARSIPSFRKDSGEMAGKLWLQSLEMVKLENFDLFNAA